eukprot:m.1099529 g.1099529  ORF g.1099529 m.1099529 type:complete len:363 (-) comp24316_c0_seq5:134-1222(-)
MVFQVATRRVREAKQINRHKSWMLWSCILLVGTCKSQSLPGWQDHGTRRPTDPRTRAPVTRPPTIQRTLPPRGAPSGTRETQPPTMSPSHVGIDTSGPLARTLHPTPPRFPGMGTLPPSTALLPPPFSRSNPGLPQCDLLEYINAVRASEERTCPAGFNIGATPDADQSIEGVLSRESETYCGGQQQGSCTSNCILPCGGPLSAGNATLLRCNSTTGMFTGAINLCVRLVRNSVLQDTLPTCSCSAEGMTDVVFCEKPRALSILSHSVDCERVNYDGSCPSDACYRPCIRRNSLKSRKYWKFTAFGRLYRGDPETLPELIDLPASQFLPYHETLCCDVTCGMCPQHVMLGSNRQLVCNRVLM